MYIQRFCSISPAGVLTPESDPASLQAISGASAPCIEPDYKDLIPPMQLRRMTKPVRTGVAAAKLCLKDSTFDMPASIHVGTAYGMLQDSEHFLQKMIVQEEQMLNPTAFIQSTHNTVAGQIALSMGCMAHNMTFVHHAHSFESALLDARLMPEQKGILVGAVDECTPTSFAILERFGVYHEHNTAGEGASFFLLSDEDNEHSLARITDFHMFTAESPEAAAGAAREHIERQHLIPDAKDHVLPGVTTDELPEVFAGMAHTRFKDYCGEFPTASGFALALAVLKIKSGEAQRCWIWNRLGKHYSMFLIEEA